MRLPGRKGARHLQAVHETRPFAESTRWQSLSLAKSPGPGGPRARQSSMSPSTPRSQERATPGFPVQAGKESTAPSRGPDASWLADAAPARVTPPIARFLQRRTRASNERSSAVLQGVDGEEVPYKSSEPTCTDEAAFGQHDGTTAPIDLFAGQLRHSILAALSKQGGQEGCPAIRAGHQISSVEANKAALLG